MTRANIINTLIRKYGYESYLEIGVNNGINFDSIKCDYKIGVDPDPTSKATLQMTSDDFFENNFQQFDIVFVDGLHHADQCYKDINNALFYLNDVGTIVVHDCHPRSEAAQKVPRAQKVWNGDVWKAWIKMRATKNLEMYVIDTDEGCGVIRKGKSEGVNIKNITYKEFEKDKVNLLNLKPVSYFENIIKK